MASPRAARAPRAVCTFALLAACIIGPYTNTDGSSSSETTADPAESGAAPTTGLTSASTSATTSSGTSSTSSPGSTSTSDQTSTSTTTFPPLDCPVHAQCRCDTWTQNCPPGEKCNIYAAIGGSSWDSAKCFPVMEDPAQLGDPCFVVENGVSGIDNCDVGLICWEPDKQNEGHCIAYCTGSPSEYACPAGYACDYWSDLGGLCLHACDPLLQDCEPGEVCIMIEWAEFACVFDGSGDQGQSHDPCELANSCDPGLECLNSTAAMECDPAASGCCEPYCDITLPNTCPGQGQQCLPIFETDPPPEYANVGICSLPP